MLEVRYGIRNCHFELSELSVRNLKHAEIPFLPQAGSSLCSDGMTRINVLDLRQKPPTTKHLLPCQYIVQKV